MSERTLDVAASGTNFGAFVRRVAMIFPKLLLYSVLNCIKAIQLWIKCTYIDSCISRPSLAVS